jgi:hypothetical protein
MEKPLLDIRLLGAPPLPNTFPLQPPPTLDPSPEGFPHQEPGLPPSWFYPDLEQAFPPPTCTLQEIGLIASSLDPSNLNGWDDILGDSSGTLGPPTADTTPPPNQSHRKHRRNKCISAAAIELNIVLGQDITMAEAADMVDKTLVGKSYGHHFSFKTLQSWVSDSWRGSPPQLNRLSKGWFMLKFANHTLAMKNPFKVVGASTPPMYS